MDDSVEVVGPREGLMAFVNVGREPPVDVSPERASLVDRKRLEVLRDYFRLVEGLLLVGGKRVHRGRLAAWKRLTCRTLIGSRGGNVARD